MDFIEKSYKEMIYYEIPFLMRIKMLKLFLHQELDLIKGIF